MRSLLNDQAEEAKNREKKLQDEINTLRNLQKAQALNTERVSAAKTNDGWQREKEAMLQQHQTQQHRMMHDSQPQQNPTLLAKQAAIEAYDKREKAQHTREGMQQAVKPRTPGPVVLKRGKPPKITIASGVPVWSNAPAKSLSPPTHALNVGAETSSPMLPGMEAYNEDATRPDTPSKTHVYKTGVPGTELGELTAVPTSVEHSIWNNTNFNSRWSK